MMGHAGADPEISFGGHEAPRSSAAGARIEAPQATRGVGYCIFFNIAL